MPESFSFVERILKLAGVKTLGRGESRRYLVLPEDFEEEHVNTFRQVERFTMTRPMRVYSLIEAVKYVVRNGIEGDFVECGVWRGGSVMAMALTLMRLGSKRNIHLYDTFAGMTAPGHDDVTTSGDPASAKFRRLKSGDSTADWCRSSLPEVTENVIGTGYDASRFFFHEGRVEETLPSEAPEKIALLRLDTDFYDSTRHELIHLYPLLSHGGVLILDDYGHWQGARKAVDEYIREHNLPLLLNRIDFAGRIAVKP